MEDTIKEVGRILKLMEKEFILGLMEKYTKAILKMM